MQVNNVEDWDMSKLYQCNGVIANWLMREKHLPSFSQKDNVWYFSKTQALEDALKDLPFYLKIARNFR